MQQQKYLSIKKKQKKTDQVFLYEKSKHWFFTNNINRSNYQKKNNLNVFKKIQFIRFAI